MTEIEEDIFSKTIDNKGNTKITINNGNTSFEIDWHQLPGWREKMIKNIPKFELHHGIDIPKINNEPPILLEKLKEELKNKGFDIGGFFIFDKKDRWSYRTNEFSNENYDLIFPPVTKNPVSRCFFI